METSRGNEVFIEVNTLEDYAKGKKLFAQFFTEGSPEILDLVSMGVVEGGTQKGKTSLMFLILNPESGKYGVAQLPLSILNALNAMANSADASFKQPIKNQEHN